MGWVVRSREEDVQRAPWQREPEEQLRCCLRFSLSTSEGAATSPEWVQALGKLQGESATDLH